MVTVCPASGGRAEFVCPTEHFTWLVLLDITALGLMLETHTPAHDRGIRGHAREIRECRERRDMSTEPAIPGRIKCNHARSCSNHVHTTHQRPVQRLC